MEIKRINRICKVMGYGETHPLHIIADDNKDYILKTKIKTFDADDDYIASSKELFAEILSYIYLNFLHYHIVSATFQNNHAKIMPNKQGYPRWTAYILCSIAP